MLNILRILFLLALLLGLVFLQIFLSKKSSRVPGLILPFLSFLFGLLFPLNMAALPGISLTAMLFQLFLVFLLGNIPTLILLLIYFLCRKKLSQGKQLNKMHIQDLH
ncbi:MAG: hypothetical protein Q4B50_02655 [Bacillota bacterium]|nr:hypothetical protein [Bacillota bacterium]